MIVAHLSMPSYGLLEPAALGVIYPLSWVDGTASMFDLQDGQTKMCGKRFLRHPYCARIAILKKCVSKAR
jgi:hypothetical protein